MRQSGTTTVDIADVLATAKTLQGQMSSGETSVRLTITSGAGEVGPIPEDNIVEKPFKIVIQSETADIAYGHAKDLENIGCNCVSSGETEVTCTCPD